MEGWVGRKSELVVWCLLRLGCDDIPFLHILVYIFECICVFEQASCLDCDVVMCIIQNGRRIFTATCAFENEYI